MSVEQIHGLGSEIKERDSSVVRTTLLNSIEIDWELEESTSLGRGILKNATAASGKVAGL